jgi:hypothetical protein
MKDSYARLGGYSAMAVGLLSLLYALFYLVISRSSETSGMLGSWIILAVSGLFSSAAYTALYLRLEAQNKFLALWALILGAAASFATFQHGAYEALLLTGPQKAASSTALPSPVDPAGLATFLVVGLVSLLFSLLILQSRRLPSALGYLGLFNAFLLVVLFLATAAGSKSLILLTGGLTSVIVGPIWWIGLGLSLLGGRRALVLGRAH